jgi:hypothetical protein
MDRQEYGIRLTRRSNGIKPSRRLAQAVFLATKDELSDLLDVINLMACPIGVSIDILDEPSKEAASGQLDKVSDKPET